MRTALVLLLVALGQDGPVPEPVKKAQAKLLASPDDPEANLVVGRFLAFDQGLWEAGLALIVKGSDGLLKSLAEKDLAGKDPVDRGDDWLGTAAKRPAFRAACQERAGYWYKKAWASAEGAAKEKLRDRFRKFAAAPAGYEKPVPAAGVLSGWDAPGDFWKALLEPAFAHSGRQSMKILPAGKDNTSGVSGFNSQAVPVVAGRKYVFTAWTFTDKTDVDGSFRARVTDQAGKILVDEQTTVPMDSPFWQKLQLEVTPPEGAFRMTVNFGAQIKQGAVWVDDVSMKLETKELLRNGGFEEK